MHSRLFKIETIVLCMWLIFLTCSNELEPREEQLPDIMWCRDPFMEQLNEIEEMDGNKN